MSQHFITTHNGSGQAVFSDKISTSAQLIPTFPGTSVEHGSLQFLYANDFNPDLSTDSDIDAFSTLRTHGHPPGSICPPNGTSSVIVTYAPGAAVPMHRTMTLDTLIVLEGVLELVLDSGESKLLNAGDTVIQRGTSHQWRNVTPNAGVARMIAITQPIQQPLEIGGKKLGTEWPRRESSTLKTAD